MELDEWNTDALANLEGNSVEATQWNHETIRYPIGMRPRSMRREHWIPRLNQGKRVQGTGMTSYLSDATPPHDASYTYMLGGSRAGYG
jgi:hypothetical protein